MSIPLPCTLFIFSFPSAVISNFLSLDTIKASELTPAPLSVLIIFIWPAYIPPSWEASIATLAGVLDSIFSIFPSLSILLEPVITFKSALVTKLPASSKVLESNST